MAGRVASIVVGFALIVGAAVLYTEPFTPTLPPSAIPNYTHPEAPPLAGGDDPRLVRQPDEAPLAYATRLNGEIFRAFAHCTPADSVAHSWLHYALHRAGFAYVTEQGLLTGRRNLCGFCHQAAHIEAAALRRNGIEAQAFGLSGHVVVRADIDGRTYYLDPDYGVGPFDEGATGFRDQLDGAYTPLVGIPEATRIASFYTSREDNQPYYSDAYLDALEHRQAALLVIQDMLLVLAIAVGALCIWRGLRPRRSTDRSAAWARQSSRPPRLPGGPMPEAAPYGSSSAPPASSAGSKG